MTQHMTHVGFDTVEAAREWRAQQGGHLFVATTGAATWFPPTMTASAVFRHPAVQGQAGTLQPNETIKYGVWCTVHGGITGFRAAWMKRNGEIQLFDSQAEADAAARNARASISDATRQRATFEYQGRRFA